MLLYYKCICQKHNHTACKGYRNHVLSDYLRIVLAVYIAKSIRLRYDTKPKTSFLDLFSEIMSKRANGCLIYTNFIDTMNVTDNTNS